MWWLLCSGFDQFSGIHQERKYTIILSMGKWKYPTLCDPMDCIVHGILQARIWEWVAFPFSRVSSQPRDWSQVSCIAGRFFASWATKEAQESWSGSQSFYSGSSKPRNWTGMSCIAGGFFTNWTMAKKANFQTCWILIISKAIHWS